MAPDVFIQRALCPYLLSSPGSRWLATTMLISVRLRHVPLTYLPGGCRLPAACQDASVRHVPPRQPQKNLSACCRAPLATSTPCTANRFTRLPRLGIPSAPTEHREAIVDSKATVAPLRPAPMWIPTTCTCAPLVTSEYCTAGCPVLRAHATTLGHSVNASVLTTLTTTPPSWLSQAADEPFGDCLLPHYLPNAPLVHRDVCTELQALPDVTVVTDADSAFEEKNDDIVEGDVGHATCPAVTRETNVDSFGDENNADRLEGCDGQVTCPAVPVEADADSDADEKNYFVERDVGRVTYATPCWQPRLPSPSDWTRHKLAAALAARAQLKDYMASNTAALTAGDAAVGGKHVRTPENRGSASNLENAGNFLVDDSRKRSCPETFDDIIANAPWRRHASAAGSLAADSPTSLAAGLPAASAAGFPAARAAIAEALAEALSGA